MARDFKIDGVTPSKVIIGNTPVNLIEFSTNGVIWARPLASLTVAKDANIKEITVSKESLTGATSTITMTVASATYPNWLNYGDNVTFTAAAADATVTRETQTVTGSRTISESISGSQTVTGSISGTQTVTSATTGYQTVTSATTGYQTVTSATTGYQTVTSATTGYQTVTSATYQTDTSYNSWYVSFNGNGSSYGGTSTVYGSTSIRRDGTHYSYQSRSGTHYSNQSRPGTHYSNQSRPGTHYSNQSRPGTHYSYQSRTGVRTYNQSRTGTRYYDQSRDVYQERNKTRSFSVNSWTGTVSGSTASISLLDAVADSISEAVVGSYTDSYTSWSDYDYGSWQTDSTRDSWGEWQTDSTSDSWNAWTETGSEDKDWGSWSEYSSSNGNWGSWSEYSSSDGNWGSWSEYSSSDGNWGGWSQYSSEDKGWGGWYTTGYNSISMPNCGFIRPLYVFDYWSMGSTSGAAVSPGSGYSGGTTTAYAHWSENGYLKTNTYFAFFEDTMDNTLYAANFYVYTKSIPFGTALNSITFYNSSGSQIGTLTPTVAGRILPSNGSKTVSAWNQSYSDWFGAQYAIVTLNDSITISIPVSYE